MTGKNFFLLNVNLRGEILHLLVEGHILSRHQKKEETRLEETLAERRNEAMAPYSFRIRGSDTEHSDSPYAPRRQIRRRDSARKGTG